MLFEQTDVNKGAKFSECRKYRYALWRLWDFNKPKIMFIGLNPSSANENEDDPTIRRVVRFAKDWGYGGIYMCNLFAIVSPDPKILLSCADPVGDNDNWLMKFEELCKDKLFGWGNFPEAERRARIVAPWFPDALCLGKNKNGTPKHPLYIAANTKPIVFNSTQKDKV